jgi:hypothetical protein
MIENFVLQQFAMDWELLCATTKHYEHWADAAPGEYPKGDDCANLAVAVAHAEAQCRRLELQISLDRASRFLPNAKQGRHTYSTIYSELRNLTDSIKSEMADRMLLVVPLERSSFFEHPALFGPHINDKFKSAVDDIKAAGNCLAVDLNTAAIFHLMRVVEAGLRALARKERVKVKRGPLNYAEWGTIISAIELKLKGKTPKLPGQRRAEALEFTNGVLGEFNGFKDVWRNHVSHSRKSYDSKDGLQVYFKVSDFMKRLSSRVHEYPKRPMAG